MQQNYNVVFGIPYNLLVVPNGTADFFDVRKAEDKQRLYQLLGNSSN